MDPDALAKLILAITIGISLVVISFQVARVFANIADLLKDMRKVAQNVGVASDMFLEDYEMVHDLIVNLTKVLQGVAGILAPISFVGGLLNRRGDEKVQPNPEKE